jgi:HSP20 family protein
MAIMKWEPRRELAGFERNMRRLFDDFDHNFFNQSPVANHGTFLPMVDINEDKDNLYIIAELPGMSAEDVKLTVSEGVLIVRGEKKRKEEQHDRNFYRMERSYGEFLRQFTLPEDVKDEDIKADFEKGILEIVIPKKEPSKPKEREVKIGSGNRAMTDRRSNSMNGNSHAQNIPIEQESGRR